MIDQMDIQKRMEWLGRQVKLEATKAADAYERASFFQFELENLRAQIENAELSRVGEMLRQYETTGQLYTGAVPK